MADTSQNDIETSVEVTENRTKETGTTEPAVEETRGDKVAPILWPPSGGDIRIWSILSRQNDGFWQVKTKKSNNIYIVDGKGAYGDKALFRFYPQPPLEEGCARPEPVDDEIPAWIGIPGKRVSGADKSKIYMLQWITDSKGKKTVQAKGYKKPDDARDPPDIPNEDRRSCTFYVQFESLKEYFTFRDTEDSTPGYEKKGGFIKTNNKGDIDRVPGNLTSVSGASRPYNDPGVLYYITDLGYTP
ncbi:uncharacterized protein LOC144452919 [Glandiceps talaboti]